MQTVEEIQTEEQAFTHAVCRSAILVGDTLLDQNAILLPEVWEYFEKTFQEVIMITGMSPQHELNYYGKSKLAIKSDVCIFTTAHGLPMLSKAVWNSTIPLWG